MNMKIRTSLIAVSHIRLDSILLFNTLSPPYFTLTLTLRLKGACRPLLPDRLPPYLLISVFLFA